MIRRLLIGLVAACALVGFGCGDEPEPSSRSVSPPAGTPEVDAAQIETPKVDASKVEEAQTKVADALKAEASKLTATDAPTLDSPEVQALIRFFMGNAAELIRPTGFLPLPDSVYQENLRTAREAVGGRP